MREGENYLRVVCRYKRGRERERERERILITDFSSRILVNYVRVAMMMMFA
jgi:hypothetical protein